MELLFQDLRGMRLKSPRRCSEGVQRYLLSFLALFHLFFIILRHGLSTSLRPHLPVCRPWVFCYFSALSRHQSTQLPIQGSIQNRRVWQEGRICSRRRRHRDRWPLRKQFVESLVPEHHMDAGLDNQMRTSLRRSRRSSKCLSKLPTFCH